MGAIISLVGGRALAWLVLGGGGLIVVISLWQGAKHKGGLIEAAKWRAAVHEKVVEDRQTNFKIDTQTMIEQGNLQQQERAIIEKWAERARTKQAEGKAP
jgi:hypothetical protein